MEELMVPFTEKVEEGVEDSVFDLYVSVWADYIHKMAIASVLFFITCPWAAFFWPPYYSIQRRDK